MALLLYNSFQGGSNSTPMTTGNTGGASGSAFDAVATTVPNFSTTQAAHGGLAAAVQAAGNVQWTSAGGSITGSPTTLWGRCYVLITVTPTVATHIPTLGTPTGTTGFVQLTTAAKVSHQAKSGTVITSTMTLSTTTWYRLEFKHFVTISGNCTWDTTIYLGDSTTASETMTQATGAGVSTDTAITSCKWGSTNANAANVVFFDDVQLNDRGFPGPYLGSLPTWTHRGVSQAVDRASTY